MINLVDELERLYFMSKYGFEVQHLERIDNIENAKKFMWEITTNVRIHIEGFNS